MVLLADGGSTKVDWVALDSISGEEVFRCRTHGLNPALLSKDALQNHIISNIQLNQVKNKVSKVFFYGAGCGTNIAAKKLKSVFESVFSHAQIVVEEDMLAAVYAASSGHEAIVCILGTGSNSCYFDGAKTHSNVVSLGYLLMDEASGNYFGKQLLRDYFYKKMPVEIASDFEKSYNLSADEIKRNLYRAESPNAYLGNFAQFMFNYTTHEYMHKLLEKGFTEFFEYRVLPFQKNKDVPIYFIGSIAHFFKPVLEEVASKYNLSISGVLRRPIDKLIRYHQNLL